MNGIVCQKGMVMGSALVVLAVLIELCICISDESPSTCDMFLNEGGLDLFLDVLRVSMICTQ